MYIFISISSVLFLHLISMHPMLSLHDLVLFGGRIVLHRIRVCRVQTSGCFVLRRCVDRCTRLSQQGVPRRTSKLPERGPGRHCFPALLRVAVSGSVELGIGPSQLAQLAVLTGSQLNKPLASV